jgi:hypothetical protein
LEWGEPSLSTFHKCNKFQGLFSITKKEYYKKRKKERNVPSNIPVKVQILKETAIEREVILEGK